MTPIPTWNTLTNGCTGDEAAAVALARLQEAPWLTHLGQPSDRDHEVVRVSGWLEAFRMFTEAIIRSEYRPNHGTMPSGALNAPVWLLLGRLDADDALHRKTADAANHALFEALPDRHYAAADHIAADVPADIWPASIDLVAELGAVRYTSIRVGDYLEEYIRLLFIEIYAGDVTEPRCTYFRDQMGWFLAGFLPCGWEGEWPEGRMKVF